MFHLISALYISHSKKEQYNIAVLGLDKSGKTTLMEYLKNFYRNVNETKTKKKSYNGESEFDNDEKKVSESQLEHIEKKKYMATVGQNVLKIMVKRKKQNKNNIRQKIILKFWDMGGEKSLRKLWRQYYGSCHGIIFMVDANDQNRYDESFEAFKGIVEDDEWEDNTIDVPVLVFANKSEKIDWHKNEIFERICCETEVMDIKIIPASIFKEWGVREGIEWLIRRMLYNSKNKRPLYN